VFSTWPLPGSYLEDSWVAREGSRRPPKSHLTLNGRNIPFVNSVKYLGVIFDKKVTWRLHIEMIKAKTFRMHIRILADYPALPGYLFIPRLIVAFDISVVTEPLSSYQQFLIAGFRGYESCTHTRLPKRSPARWSGRPVDPANCPLVSKK
jgi:hypothetical protein